MARLLKWLTHITLGVAVMVSLMAFLLPAVLGSRAAIVLSGSMEPVLRLGGIAFIQPTDAATVRVGDLIAFNPEHDPDVTVCHRVVEVVDAESPTFRTKGDANEDPDPYSVTGASVRGKVNFSIPYAGYLLHYTGRYVRNLFGLALLIACPSLLIIGSAVRDVDFALSPAKRRARWQQTRGERQEKRARRRHKTKEPRRRRRRQPSFLPSWMSW